jgi:hypothetical protein
MLLSDQFLERALLLVLGAALTGILVPVVKASMDRTSFERQKRLEAQLARQADIIRAQTQFLRDFSNLVWEFHKICQRVSYTRLSGEREAYDLAVADFRNSLWDVLQRARSEIGSARWFCSDTVHAALVHWYDEWFLTVERDLRRLIDTDPAPDEWLKHHNQVHARAGTTNYGLLKFLSEQFGLLSLVKDGDPAGID